MKLIRDAAQLSFHVEVFNLSNTIQDTGTYSPQGFKTQRAPL